MTHLEIKRILVEPEESRKMNTFRYRTNNGEETALTS